MSTEELLKPRYKVIADYPESIFKTNEILYCIYDGEYGNQYSFGKNQFYEGLYPEMYPHLFRRLHWAEDREPGELPEYLKGVDGYFKDKFYKLLDLSQDFREHHNETELERRTFKSWCKCFEPATLAEYEAFKSKQK